MSSPALASTTAIASLDVNFRAVEPLRAAGIVTVADVLALSTSEIVRRTKLSPALVAALKVRKFALFATNARVCNV